MKQIDPQVRQLLEKAARSPWPPYHTLTPAQAREQYRQTRAPLHPESPDVAEVRDLAMPGSGGPLALRLYRARGTQRDALLPAVVYFHGGGWVVGDLDTHDVVCRQLANAARCAVIAVDYRLAPEHRFPAAVEDSVAATLWVAQQAALLGIDAARISVAGDSAGGNLAAVTAITLRDLGPAGGPPLVAQLLIYPVTDQACNSVSAQAYAEGYLLTRPNMLWYRDSYLRNGDDIGDWRASPLCAAGLAGLPPAYVITAGFDPLLDEGQAYAEALGAAGVEVTYECFEGMVHGFITMGGVLAGAGHLVYRLAQFLNRRPAEADVPKRRTM
jgi:acetyl esterase